MSIDNKPSTGLSSYHVELLQIISDAPDGAEYKWTKALAVQNIGGGAADSVWPPPPVAASGVGGCRDLVGELVLENYKVVMDETRLTVSRLLPGNITDNIGFIVFAVFLTVIFWPLLTLGSPVFVLLFVSFLVGMGYYLWRSPKIIQIDRSRGQVSIGGKRFAPIHELETVMVRPRPVFYRTTPFEKQGSIAVCSEGGKSFRLLMLESSDMTEVNLIARIAGDYLTASLRA